MLTFPTFTQVTPLIVTLSSFTLSPDWHLIFSLTNLWYKEESEFVIMILMRATATTSIVIAINHCHLRLRLSYMSMMMIIYQDSYWKQVLEEEELGGYQSVEGPTPGSSSFTVKLSLSNFHTFTFTLWKVMFVYLSLSNSYFHFQTLTLKVLLSQRGRPHTRFVIFHFQTFTS